MNASQQDPVGAITGFRDTSYYKWSRQISAKGQLPCWGALESRLRWKRGKGQLLLCSPQTSRVFRGKQHSLPSMASRGFLHTFLFFLLWWCFWCSLLVRLTVRCARLYFVRHGRKADSELQHQQTRSDTRRSPKSQMNITYYRHLWAEFRGIMRSWHSQPRLYATWLATHDLRVYIFRLIFGFSPLSDWTLKKSR